MRHIKLGEWALHVEYTIKHSFTDRIVFGLREFFSPFPLQEALRRPKTVQPFTQFRIMYYSLKIGGIYPKWWWKRGHHVSRDFTLHVSKADLKDPTCIHVFKLYSVHRVLKYVLILYILYSCPIDCSKGVPNCPLLKTRSPCFPSHDPPRFQILITWPTMFRKTLRNPPCFHHHLG